MSVEKAARRYLRRMIFWRIAGAFFDLPVRLCNIIHSFLAFLQGVCVTVHGFFVDISHSVYYLELDAARKHKALTDVDMGKAAGDAGRYHLLDLEYQETDRAMRIQGQKS